MSHGTRRGVIYFFLSRHVRSAAARGVVVANHAEEDRCSPAPVVDASRPPTPCEASHATRHLADVRLPTAVEEKNSRHAALNKALGRTKKWGLL